jgi:beta-N-acetylhexosaminidase
LSPTETIAAGPANPPRAVIFGCAGPRLTAAEAAFFRDSDPLGFILFKRNCETPEQLAALTADLRASVGRADAPILIDQEGGRVVRMGAPHWRVPPSAGAIGALAAVDLERASRAAWLNARLVSEDLGRAGIDICCLPVLDLQYPGASEVVGDRAFSADPDVVALLGRAAAEGLLDGGVLPAIKHMPGHGRAMSDSHHEMPRVDASLAELEASDFRPFRALADLPIGLSAHILFTALDCDLPGTLSAKVIAEAIRGAIGFDGLLLSDDLSMQALSGSLGERAAAALAAGCDIALHCNGVPDEMADIAARTGAMSADALRRWAAAREHFHKRKNINFNILKEEFDNLVKDCSCA